LENIVDLELEVSSEMPQEGVAEKCEQPELDGLTPRQIVEELDKYIIGQEEAKKAVAIALRNRWRRQQVGDDLRDEILPNNLILIGTTGVGKTEIARRLARLAGAPFVKVEASKYTEVGYVGRDVESMIRDLVDVSVNMVRAEREEEIQGIADSRVEDKILDLLLPLSNETTSAGDRIDTGTPFLAGPEGIEPPHSMDPLGDRGNRGGRTRKKFRELLRSGELDEQEIEVEVSQSASLEGMVLPVGGGVEGIDHNLTEMLQDLLPKRKKTRTVSVKEARKILVQEELDVLIDMDEVVTDALFRAEDTGIVFLDEIDKIAGDRGGTGPDIGREGVQRDILPIVEGSTVQTKYGLVQTDHVLFIAAGAFHVSKPTDLIPELQGRFPIRVELKSLGEKEFIRILQEPKNALVHQYKALIATEGAVLEFTAEGINEVARLAAVLNDQMENIGARRLHTVLTTLLESVLFGLPEQSCRSIVVDRDFVHENLNTIVDDVDLRRYIL
jgi:ATP-dependent HslUV protease ATP-binding subunit HslU|tara:strand:+ start:13179 stop:14678 length:1500 start_codon:yes stop_codon:yes gene_type:complete